MTDEPVYLYAAVLDVLGYRYYLSKDRDSGILDFQNSMSRALTVFDGVDAATFHVQAISDTVILTCGDHPHFGEFLVLLRRVFLAFLEEGLYIRGGVSYSRHYHKNNLTYSHAVARAHELESDSAIYPRVVIDENIIRMYEVGADLPSIHSSGLICRENGTFFLDVLTRDNWGHVFQKAKDIYQASRPLFREDEAVFDKHLRFERYILSSAHASVDAAGYTDQIMPV